MLPGDKCSALLGAVNFGLTLLVFGQTISCLEPRYPALAPDVIFR